MEHLNRAIQELVNPLAGDPPQLPVVLFPDGTHLVAPANHALAAKVGDHVEIAVEAEDGTRFKIRSTSEQLDALVGDLDGILDADDADAA